MKKYKVNVNGTVYEVEVEAMDAPTAAEEKKESAPAPTGGEQITAPMPGNILKVQVREGESVRKGAVLMILEAMKMENEIMAPCDGKVVSLRVQEGAAVETGTLLCVVQ